MAVKITYNGEQIASTDESGNIEVTYDGETISTISSGTSKTLSCSGKYMNTNAEVGSKTLQCQDNIMSTDVGIEYEATEKNLVVTLDGQSPSNTTATYYGTYVVVNGTQYYTRGDIITINVGDTIQIYGKPGYKKLLSAYTTTINVNLNGTQVATTGTPSAGVTTYSLLYSFTASANTMISLCSGTTSYSTSTITTEILTQETGKIKISGEGGTNSSGFMQSYVVVGSTSYTTTSTVTINTSIWFEYHGCPDTIGTIHYSIALYVNGTYVGESADGWKTLYENTFTSSDSVLAFIVNDPDPTDSYKVYMFVN